MYQKRKSLEKGMLMLLDLFCIVVSLIIAYHMRYGIFLGIAETGDQFWLVVIVALLSVFVGTLFDFSHHFFRRGAMEELEAVVKEQVIFSVLWVVSLYLLHRANVLSRLVFTYFVAVNTVLTYISHLLLKQYMVKIYRKSKYSNRLMVVTTKGQVTNVVENIIRYNEWNRDLTGIALLDEKVSSKEQVKIDDVPVVADADTFIDYVIHNEIDEVFIVDHERTHFSLVEPWIHQLEEMGVIVDVNIDIFDLEVHGRKALNRVGKYAVVTFARNLFPARQMAAKRALDICGSLVGMIILGIAAVFVAPAIKLESPGPVFFGQTRVGKNGRKFKIYKFRSMYQDAEARKKELMASNEMNGLMFKMEDDPRITKVGKFIRKTSIDELPQFWNVLKGDMSLVGTRPPTVDEFEQYEAKHKCRLSMTPGLTGLWQISGRSDIKDFDQVVKLDMQYIDNWSILKDIKILLRTVVVVIAGKGSR